MDRDLIPLDPDACEDIQELLEAMSRTAFGARELGRAWQVLKGIIDDPNCRLIVTISGAMSIAKLGRSIGRLISENIAHLVVTTGAVVTHSMVEELNMSHIQCTRAASDAHLLTLGLNRIYDSVEPEANLERLEEHVLQSLEALDDDRGYGSAELVTEFAKGLPSGNLGLVGCADKAGVSVFVPALNDCELGLYVYKDQLRRCRKHALYDPTRDLHAYAKWLGSHSRIAILTIGGGSPRNWAQQMFAFLRSEARDAHPVVAPLAAGIRICPDPAHFGHLSGSSFSEAVSWGKVSPDSPEHFAEVCCDATIVLPFLIKAALEYKRRGR